MSATTESTVLDTARTYHKAWTGGNLDEAMAFVDADIVCHAPGDEIVGKDAYREYLSEFMRINTGLTDIAAYSDEGRAMLLYCPHTDVTTTAPVAEQLTFRDGQIVESRLVFDRLSFGSPDQ
ncbi:MAG: nuclear transport factor 2 family protein [Pseudonocardia sp.]